LKILGQSKNNNYHPSVLTFFSIFIRIFRKNSKYFHFLYFSMKSNKKLKNKEVKKPKKHKSLSKIDILQCIFLKLSLQHRFFNKFEDQYLFPLKLLLRKRNLIQIHLRANCTIFEYDQIDKCKSPHFRIFETIINASQRLYSQFKLDFENAYELNIKQINGSGGLYEWIDEFNEKHKEDVLFMVEQQTLDKEMNLFHIVFNKTLLDWLLIEKLDFLDEEVQDSLAKFWVFMNIEEYLQNLLQIIGNGRSQFFFNIRTIVGIFRLEWNFQYFCLVESKTSYFCFIHPKNLHDKELIDKIKCTKQEALQQYKEKKNFDWGDLLRLYYLPMNFK